jgi:hypothetical protein
VRQQSRLSRVSCGCLPGLLYHHWTPFRDVADAIGHGTVRVVKDIGGGIEHGILSGLNDLTNWGF